MQVHSDDWLEVRSKHGNPPGYVGSDDARLIGRVNCETPRAAWPARNPVKRRQSGSV